VLRDRFSGAWVRLAAIFAVLGGGLLIDRIGTRRASLLFSLLVTAGAAIVFMLTSLFLAYFSGTGGTRSIMKSGGAAPIQSMPAPPAGMPAPPAGVPAMPAAPVAPPAK